MSTIEQIMRQFTEAGLETAFEVCGHRYQVFAYRSPGAGQRAPSVRWKLYELDGTSGRAVRGLTFGMAEGVREALEDVMRSAEEHAQRGVTSAPRRAGLSFRPSPQD